MSEDAQPPGTPQHGAMGPGAMPGDGTEGAPGAPGAEGPGIPGTPAGRVPGVALDKPVAGPLPTFDPWAPPADDAPRTGPGSPVPGAPVGPQDRIPGGAPFPHDQATVTALPGPGMPGAPAQEPWGHPFAPPSPTAAAPAGNPFAPPSPAPAGNPFAPPSPFAVGNPYAPPVPGQPVPPPPIGPEGPGQPTAYAYPQYPAYPGYGAPYGPQGYVPGYGWPGMPLAPSNGMGTASLVLGIISAVGFCLGPVAMFVGALAVIFGIVGRRKSNRGEATNGGMALAGIICGAVGIAVGLVVTVAIFLAPGSDDDPWTSTEDGYSTSLVVPRLP
ncbi:DUF4190 domain-containing protein [Streptomyces sp. WAC07094]|uniref:DUF4190 domain-containing protein n=1 Tax=Streptomyces sp. WAC07094 TaxID=3072183 RepID=UPI002EC5B251|nr:DUF4190 domain-containing protein [Streptomyces sp. WAC07094]